MASLTNGSLLLKPPGNINMSDSQVGTGGGQENNRESSHDLNNSGSLVNKNPCPRTNVGLYGKKVVRGHGPGSQQSGQKKAGLPLQRSDFQLKRRVEQQLSQMSDMERKVGLS